MAGSVADAGASARDAALPFELGGVVKRGWHRVVSAVMRFPLAAGALLQGRALADDECAAFHAATIT